MANSHATYERSFRGQAWWLLRKSNSVTVKDLLMTLCTKEQKCSYRNLNAWLRALYYVGVVDRRKVKQADGREVYEFSLLKDLGPLAPAVSDKGVFDQSTGKYLEQIAERLSND